MSDDETRPIDPEASQAPGAPLPPPATEERQPAYAMPLPAGYPAYPAQQRPRFVDQVLGMRGVIAVALAYLIIGGLSGFILGRASGDGQDRLIRGPGFGSFQGGPFPSGPNGSSHHQFDQGQSGR